MMIGQVALEKLKVLLKDGAHWQEYHGLAHWTATLYPVTLDLSGEFPVDELHAALQHYKDEGLISEIFCSPGEPHDDDDIYYVNFTDAGVAWLNLNQDKQRQA